jgi:hypothetical protein
MEKTKIEKSKNNKNTNQSTKTRRFKMKSLTQKLVLVLFVFGGLFMQACKDEANVVQPQNDPMQQSVITDDQIAEAVAIDISKSKEKVGDATIMHDLAIVAMQGGYSPENSDDFSDLLGWLTTDSTIVYEGDTYSTEITYDIKYKVGNRIVEDYSPLADTALISYTVHSSYDNVQFRAEREAYSVSFTVGGIKMPSTHFTVNMLSNFRMQMEYKLEPHILMYINGQSYFEDVVINAFDGTIESGVGGMQFTVSQGSFESDVIVVEIEFTGNNQAVIRVNGHEYTIDVNLGELIP